MTGDSRKQPARAGPALFRGDSPGRPLGFAAYEKVGVVVVNPRGVTRMSRTSAAPCPDCGDVPSEESAEWCRSCEALLVLRG